MSQPATILLADPSAALSAGFRPIEHQPKKSSEQEHQGIKACGCSPERATFTIASAEASCKPILDNYSDCEWRLHELGLGRGVDGSNPRPWINKSTFQVREAKVPPAICKSTWALDETDGKQGFGTSNLICTDEGGMQHEFAEEVTSIKDQSVKMDGSITVPNSPVSIAVGADLCRSLTTTKKAVGERVLNKTVAFKPVITNDDSEEHLLRYVFEFTKQQKEPGETYAKTLADMDRSLVQQAFRQFVEHYRITHYVSSIILGASRFTVQTESDYYKKMSSKGGIGYEPVGKVSASVSHQSTHKNISKSTKCIGRLAEDGTVLKEAVVDVRLESIFNLVRTENLKEPLAKALRKYMKEQREKKGTYATCMYRHTILCQSMWGNIIHV